MLLTAISPSVSMLYKSITYTCILQKNEFGYRKIFMVGFYRSNFSIAMIVIAEKMFITLVPGRHLNQKLIQHIHVYF